MVARRSLAFTAAVVALAASAAHAADSKELTFQWGTSLSTYTGYCPDVDDWTEITVAAPPGPPHQQLPDTLSIGQIIGTAVTPYALRPVFPPMHECVRYGAAGCTEFMAPPVGFFYKPKRDRDGDSYLVVVLPLPFNVSAPPGQGRSFRVLQTIAAPNDMTFKVYDAATHRPGEIGCFRAYVQNVGTPRFPTWALGLLLAAVALAAAGVAAACVLRRRRSGAAAGQGLTKKNAAGEGAAGKELEEGLADAAVVAIAPDDAA